MNFKVYILVIVCSFLLGVGSCKRSPSNQETETIAKDQKSELLIEPTAQYIKPEGKNANRLIYLSLGISLLSIAITIFTLLKNKEAISEDELIERIIESGNNRNGRIRKMMNNFIQDSGINKTGYNPLKDMEKNIDEYFQKNKNVLVDELMYIIRQDEKERELKQVKSHEQEQTQHSPVVSHNQEEKEEEQRYYVAAANEDGFFQKMTQKLTDTTVFELFIKADKRRAEFDVCREVQKRLLDTNEYLRNAADLEILGNNTIITKEKGRAELFENDKWRVVQKAKIRFE